MRRISRSAFALVVLLLISIAVLSVSGASAAPPASVTVAGEVGETVDAGASATYGGYYLRYVGDPAAAGYSHDYQWGTPFIETSPESGPVTFSGTLDLTGRQSGAVATIGLLDKQALGSGVSEFQKGAYVYVYAKSNGDVKVGPSDGNLGGGELVQTFVTIPAATADAGPLDVTFTVDGTADPTTCAKPGGTGGDGDGCLTISISGFGTLTDSYGTLTGNSSGVEFAQGAIPGWEAYPAGPTGILYDFTISPAVTNPQSKDDCMNDGWENLVDDNGSHFKNQGDCVSYVATKGKNKGNG